MRILELRRTIGRHAHAGKHDPELLRLANDVLLRWKELDDSRRLTLASALLTRFGATPGEGDINTLHAQLTASLAEAEQR